jgi:D-beta-D-heptose 7-phosphate kinase/D-beta-D-heptose 1-phosphate adenosyltransferase
MSKIPWLANKISVAIIGDLILDEYLKGDIRRISPEAPVPVHLVNEVFSSPGGAANVSRNIQLAGGQAHLFGVVGTDHSAKILLNTLIEDGVQVDGVIPVTDRPTTKKTRILASSQQVIRIDWEKTHPIDLASQEKIWDKLENLSVDAYLISDYGKGSLPKELIKKIIDHGKLKKIPVIIDPKGIDYSIYEGCSLVTPNKKEAAQASGLEEIVSGELLGQELQKKFHLSHVLVTMGAQGMVFIPDKEESDQKNTIYKKTKARQVFDVSGAGDTVAAIMALSLGSKASIEEAMDWANLAAGLVVEKLGTQPILLTELENSFYEQNGQKIFEPNDLSKISQKIRNEGKRIVFTNGCFDLFHAGHAQYLKKSKSLGDILIVALNTDDSITQIKGVHRPIVNLTHRQAVLESLACVDYITYFSDPTPLNLIKILKPHVLVKGADYQKTDIVGYDFVTELGGSVETVTLTPDISTSFLVEKIRST